MKVPSRGSAADLCALVLCIRSNASLSGALAHFASDIRVTRRNYFRYIASAGKRQLITCLTQVAS